MGVATGVGRLDPRTKMGDDWRWAWRLELSDGDGDGRRRRLLELGDDDGY
ncbi:hypothetical protein ACJRO7_016339 [Eucalyptus globulus]|uniref:Uncharacterized protein n=1 Tax=Eucalyptus globulus TaxID=34317 RepID=A0ABD3LC90_EUCGL